MKTIEHNLPHIAGLVVFFDEGEQMLRSLLRVSEYTVRPDFRYDFQVEDYAAHFGADMNELSGQVQGVMVMDYYFENLASGIGIDRLTKEEMDLIRLLQERNLLDEHVQKRQRFYVISINPAVPQYEWRGILEHEVSHVAYRTMPEYRAKTRQLYQSLSSNLRRAVKKHLLVDCGYSRVSLYNEFQAFLFHGFNPIQNSVFDAEKLKNSLEQIVKIRLPLPWLPEDEPVLPYEETQKMSQSEPILTEE